MDCYGARDGGITAYEISKGNYHVGYNSIIEIKDHSDEKTGTALVTDLYSYSFPFIRYELGDEVSLKTDLFKSVYNGQIISKVFGRTSDVINLANGHKLTGVGFQVMFGRLNVNGFRVSKIGDLKLLVEIEPSESFLEEEEKLILKIFKKHAGNDCEIEISKVDKFIPNKNGKRHYFIS
jgi:phenylacetate-CoA ligase